MGNWHLFHNLTFEVPHISWQLQYTSQLHSAPAAWSHSHASPSLCVAIIARSRLVCKTISCRLPVFLLGITANY